MRARNREVNIFNMSLLDILTGMLGAFLFLMLGLVPYYTRAKNSSPQSNPNTTPHVDTLLNVIGQWNSGATMNIYLYDPSSGWSGSNNKHAPLPRGTKVDNGACGGDVGWQNASDFAQENGRYLVTYSVEGDINPANYQQVNLSIELLAAQSKTDGSGLNGFDPLILCPVFNASGSKPNVMYALYWITVSKDASKDQYYRQWNFKYEPATTDLPAGVAPMPAPVAITSAPSQITPGPESSTNAPPPPPSSQTTHHSIFDWFHWGPSPKSK
jgi:hypothetical protein